MIAAGCLVWMSANLENPPADLVVEEALGEVEGDRNEREQALAEREDLAVVLEDNLLLHSVSMMAQNCWRTAGGQLPAVASTHKLVGAGPDLG